MSDTEPDFGFRVWLGFGGGVVGCKDVLGVLARSVLATRWVRTATKKSYPLLRSVGMPPSPPRRKGYLREAATKRVHTATITRQKQRFRIFASEHDASPLCGESSRPFVSAFVPPTWSNDEQSTHSSYHVRCGFGWERLNRCERRRRSNGENGGVTRLRQHMNRAGTWTYGVAGCLMARSWVLGFFCTEIPSSSLNLSTWSLSHSEATVERTDIMMGACRTSSPALDRNTNGTLTGPR